MKKIAALCVMFAMAAGAAHAASTRGSQSSMDAYRLNQRNTYFMVTQPDVDTACRTKIYNCLSEYCGDVTAVPGQRADRCTYASESDLYNYALLCLQKDTTLLMPQYGTGARSGGAGMNTAARLCPSYVQQELMSYLSMANMSNELSKAHSSVCVQRRQELEAAMSCHSVAIAYGNGTSSMLNSQLTDYCGAGVPGGSAEMAMKFANAGNVGANIWAWAEKMVNLDMNKKGADWQAAVDGVLAGYTNRMNLACGDNLTAATSGYSAGSADSAQPTTLQTAAALAVGMAFPTEKAPEVENPFQASVWMEVQSLSDVYSYAEAQQVVNAGLTNVSTTQNAFLSAGQMDSMQRAYAVNQTKVFILRDSARCYMVPVAELSFYERSLVSQSFANCVSQ